MSEDVLYSKFTVIKNSTGEHVDDCFVLRPNTDPAARIALKAYAEAVKTEKPQLYEELSWWLECLDDWEV